MPSVLLVWPVLQTHVEVLGSQKALVTQSVCTRGACLRFLAGGTAVVVVIVVVGAVVVVVAAVVVVIVPVPFVVGSAVVVGGAVVVGVQVSPNSK